jgi:hypothetical protein
MPLKGESPASHPRPPPQVAEGAVPSGSELSFSSYRELPTRLDRGVGERLPHGRTDRKRCRQEAILPGATGDQGGLWVASVVRLLVQCPYD